MLVFAKLRPLDPVLVFLLFYRFKASFYPQAQHGFLHDTLRISCNLDLGKLGIWNVSGFFCFFSFFDFFGVLGAVSFLDFFILNHPIVSFSTFNITSTSSVTHISSISATNSAIEASSAFRVFKLLKI